LYDHVFPPYDVAGSGLWFYIGFISLLIGDLLVAPYFSKPVDSISACVVGLLGVILVNDWSDWEKFEKGIYIMVIIILGTILIASIISLFNSNKNNFLVFLNRSTYLISSKIGNQRFIFSLVILYAIYIFHRQVPNEFVLLILTWVLVVMVKPLEFLTGIVQDVSKFWKNGILDNEIGYVSAYQTPGIILIKQDQNTITNFGEIILYQNFHSTPNAGITLNYVGRDSELLLRALEFDLPESILDLVHEEYQSAPINSVRVFDYFKKHPEYKKEVLILDRIKDLIGLVDENSDVNLLKFEIIQDCDLSVGDVVEVIMNEDTFLFQILDGITVEEKVFQRNKYGFIVAEAVPIGIWREEGNKLEPIGWVPQINSPVFKMKDQKSRISFKTIGHFPNTEFNVELKDINSLVTHNTAILGILGIGKSMLSIELTERLISTKIKVICIDLTNQYADLLTDFYDKENEESKLAEYYRIGATGKSNVSKHVEEGGSINQVRDAIKKCLDEFINKEPGKFLKIFNPSHFDVWKQDSKPYQGTASMMSLTPTEITQIITECTLGICQDNGMTDSARVCLIFEEAHSLIPEWNSVASEGDKNATNGTARAILQGRKYGLGCILVTQRTANVTKTILNQCNTIFAMRTFDDTGKNFISNYIGSNYANKLSTLQERQAVFYGKASSCENPVLIRLNDRDKFLKVFRKEVPPPEIHIKNSQEDIIAEDKNDMIDDLPF
jgi:hypothetical protein